MNEIKVPKVLNIYQKLQKSRVELQKQAMKKSGENKFSHYVYFELGDFLPQINKIAALNGLTSIFNYTSELATLTIIDNDNIESTILFTTPVVTSELKGCMPMQSVGAMQTYARRYLYVMAYEISENDIISNAEVDEDAEFGKKKINSTKVDSIKSTIAKSHSNEANFCKWAKVSKIEDITNKEFALCASTLEKALDKYEKDNKINALEGVI